MKDQVNIAAHNLRMIRLAHGYSTIELAEILGFADSTVIRNESREPTIGYVDRFCTELKVKPAALVIRWLAIAEE